MELDTLTRGELYVREIEMVSLVDALTRRVSRMLLGSHYMMALPCRLLSRYRGVACFRGNRGMILQCTVGVWFGTRAANLALSHMGSGSIIYTWGGHGHHIYCFISSSMLFIYMLLRFLT